MAYRLRKTITIAHKEEMYAELHRTYHGKKKYQAL